MPSLIGNKPNQVPSNGDLGTMAFREQDQFLALAGTQTVSGAKTFSEIITASKGVAFPATQVASADANTLDDYEEGTWTPTVRGTSVAGTGTYSIQQGTYVKIGKSVTVSFRCLWTNLTGASGNLMIGGLPFTIDSATVQFCMIAVASQNLTYTSGKTLFAGWGSSGASYVAFDITEAGASAGIANVAIDTSADIFGTVTYIATT